MSSNDHLAVKYRPTSLDEMIGQDFAVGSVKGMLERGKFPPTILISGPYSSGKTTLARLIAYYACCTDTSTPEPCGKCKSCLISLKAIKGQSAHPDVSELNVALDGGIDVIRRLNSLAQLAPRYRYRIFIMDEAHQITRAAFQGALKMFEEPADTTRFILCTTNPEKLPDTIRSRCQIINLVPMDKLVAARRLFQIAKLEGLDLPKDTLKKLCVDLSTATNGHLRDALGALDNVLNYLSSGGGIDKIDPASMQKLIDKATADSPYVLVQQYMNALFSGNRARAFLAVKLTPNPEYFVRSVLGVLNQILYQWVDFNTLVDKDQYWMMKNIKNIPPQDFGRKLLESTNDIPDLLNEFNTVLERLKTYTGDPVSLMNMATIHCFQLMDKWFDQSK